MMRPGRFRWQARFLGVGRDDAGPERDDGAGNPWVARSNVATSAGWPPSNVRRVQVICSATCRDSEATAKVAVAVSDRQGKVICRYGLAMYAPEAARFW